MHGLAAPTLRLLSLGLVAWALAAPLRAESPVPNDDVIGTFANGRNSAIPCKFVLNTILLPVPTPDKSHAYLILDTGAGVPMISESFARKLRIRGSTQFPAVGIGQKVSVGSVSTGITFSLSGLTFHNAHWALLPNVALDASFGLPVEGVLGLDLLKHFVIRIDYAAQTVEFVNPSAFRPPGGDAVCLPLILREQGLMVNATVKTQQASAEGQFLFDTGNNGTFDLSKLFQDRHPELKFRQFAQSGASGVGGTLLSSEAICPAIVLGGISLPGPLVDLDQAVQGVEAEMDGGIGNEIWRRFRLTIDMPNRKMYLQKNALFAQPFSYVTSGMNVLASGTHYEKLTIHEVLPNSAGEKAGFEQGDILEKIDELGATPLVMANVYPLVHRAGTSHFTVKRDGKAVALTLELKEPQD